MDNLRLGIAVAPVVWLKNQAGCHGYPRVILGVQFQPETVSSLKWNRCPVSARNRVQFRPEYAGYSTGPVQERIKNASEEPTYLMAPVTLVEVYECYNLNPQKFELLLHTFFGQACLEVDVFDKNGKRYSPREWFIAPLHIIGAAAEMLINGEIVNYRYDTRTSEIVER